MLVLDTREETIVNRIILAAVVMFVVAGCVPDGQGADVQKLIQDTQILDQNQDKFRLIWWIPTEYWEESFRDVPSFTADQKQEFYRAVDDYIVFCVVDATMSPFGSVIPASRDQIADDLSLVIDQGAQQRPLTDARVSSDAKNLFAMMKPVMANMLGQFGQGMEFFCFKGTDSEGKALLDPKGKGALSVHLGKATYKWRLPLGSLLPPKYDPQTGEAFPGNYIYSPFTGQKLTSESLKNPDAGGR